MRIYRLALVLTCVLAAWLGAAGSQDTSAECSSCVVAEQALHDLQSVKAGMRRAAVEKYFVRAGGMTFRSRTDYVYRKCEYLKIQFDFRPDPAVERDFSPADTIVSISQITVAYQSRD
jgi:hypothetical protein